MSQTIWKFPFQINHSVSIRMPRYSKILCVQVQNNIPCLWVLVEKHYDEVDRLFRIVGTGEIYDDKGIGNYIGTFQLNDGEFVFHLFDEGDNG